RAPGASTTEVTLSPPQERRFDGRDFVDVPLESSPARERVRLELLASTSDLTLHPARPVSLVPDHASAFGLLPCVVDGRTDLAVVLLALVALQLAGLGWLAAAVITGGGASGGGPISRH